MNKIFKKIGMCVWLVDNRIIGWKVSCKHIDSPLHYNTLNWFPFSSYDKFKKLNIYVPCFIYNYAFSKLSKIWFKRWIHHEKFKGFRAY